MKSVNSKIGDDGAVLGRTVYSKDIFFENVHFKRTWLTPYQIGAKAMTINISDAIAMNATPRYALLGVAMPRTINRHEMDELARGLKESADAYGVEIIGGDTIANAKLDISITIISDSEKPLMRHGLKIGDKIAYTGVIGQSAKQLRYLLARGKVHTHSRFVKPILRQKFIQESRPYLRCGMDISDGLFSDMDKLCSLNRLGLRWEKKISKCIGCSGEEYEMLIAFSPRNEKTLRRTALRTRTPFSIVATARRGKFINRCKAHHF